MKKVLSSISAVFILSAIAVSISLQTSANSMTQENGASRACKLNPDIQRKAIPQTPHDMSLPSFGRGVIGWGTGMEGAKERLKNITKQDIAAFKAQDLTLNMVKAWQAFYENEVRRNDCNPTAPYRAQLMKKIAELWD